jgi:simple sugar transport system permease protein/ribose transport system permease protein
MSTETTGMPGGSPPSLGPEATAGRTFLPSVDRRKLLVPALVTGLVFVLLIAGGISESAFLTVDNMLTVIRAASITGIVAIGMTFITLSGNFVSLSVEQTAIISAILFALALRADWPWPVAVVVVLLAAAATGILQGGIVALGMNPIVTTLGAGAALFGLANVIVSNKTIQNGTRSAEWIGRARPLGIPTQSIAFVLLAVVGTIVLAKTRFGREVALTGANRAAAKASGINLVKVTIAAFTISAATAGLAGIFVVAQIGQAKTTMFSNLTIDAVAAVLVGGTAIQGGEGSPARTALGAVFIALLLDFMLIRGDEFGVRHLVQGVVVVLAVVGFHRLRTRTG